MKFYGALNPEQLARLFDRRAEIAKRKLALASTKIGKAVAEQEVYDFEAVAQIVRDTEFIGWTSSSRIVEEIPATLPTISES